MTGQRHFCDNRDTPLQTGIGSCAELVTHALADDWVIAPPGWFGAIQSDGKLDFEHAAFWLGTTAFAFDKPEYEGSFMFPDQFKGPDIALPNGLIARFFDVDQDPEGEGRDGSL